VALVVFSILFLLPAVHAPQGKAFARADEPSMTFAETGKTVRGRFLEYWGRNGGTVVQGLPISNEMQEKSEVDGKTYTIQYFERAVFERHPENSQPYDVLLSLLGSSLYRERYGKAVTAQKSPDTQGARFFPETGKWVGCEFLSFWEQYGGLPQLGYPVSDAIVERSQVDGKRYAVQYFQRVILEYHPELVYEAATRSYVNVVVQPLGTLRFASLYASQLPSALTAKSGDTSPCAPTTESPEIYHFGQTITDAPIRSSVGKGHTLSGTLRSSADCSPLAGAKLVFTIWGRNPETPVSAAVLTNSKGEFIFESNAPGSEGESLTSRTSASRNVGLAAPLLKPGEFGSILVYASAPGYKPITTEIRLSCNATQTFFDVVLVPLSR